MAAKAPIEKDEVEKIKCLKCRKLKTPNVSNFYANTNKLFSSEKLEICKDCLQTFIGKKGTDGYIDRVIMTLAILDKPLVMELWIDRDEEWSRYIPLVSTLQQCQGLSFSDSTIKTSVEKSIYDEAMALTVNELSELEEKNRQDVLRMVGYDPFDSESDVDKRSLYNRLVDFLDEGTLEDSFKLPTVIEIVKTFNQIDKINSAISSISSNPKTLADNVGSIKSLMDAKKNMLTSILALAKDNGISVNHNNNKSKGSGTLSGIMKQLQEKGFQEVEVNIFDVETSMGMSQVADISHQSILKQLQFDENDYAQMIVEQKQILHDMELKINKIEEENRILKIQMKDKIFTK